MVSVRGFTPTPRTRERRSPSFRWEILVLPFSRLEWPRCVNAKCRPNDGMCCRKEWYAAQQKKWWSMMWNLRHFLSSHEIYISPYHTAVIYMHPYTHKENFCPVALIYDFCIWTHTDTLRNTLRHSHHVSSVMEIFQLVGRQSRSSRTRQRNGINRIREGGEK